MVAEPQGGVAHPYLWRFFVDWRHQRLGIGRRALTAVAEHWRTVGATHLLAELRGRHARFTRAVLLHASGSRAPGT